MHVSLRTVRGDTWQERAQALDAELNLFTGLERNWLFWVIVLIICAAQALLVQFGGSAVPVRRTYA